jgi:hypothetical protein
VRGDAYAGDGLRVLTRTSGFGSLLEHADTGSALGQVGRQRYPVWPTAYDDEVIPFILAHRFLPFGDATLPSLTLRDLGAASDSRTGAEETDTQHPERERQLPPDHGLSVKSVPLYVI